jgi:hypothetical protein
VQADGRIDLTGIPFAPGTEVEVTISAKRRSAEEFTAAWQRVCTQMRKTPAAQALNDEDIQKEISDYRAGP